MVSLERRVCSFTNCKAFLVQWLKGSMSVDARDLKNIETRDVINFFLAKQGAEGNSRHSNRNIREMCTIVCHCQKLGGPV